jgi:hypothetical protein
MTAWLVRGMHAGGTSISRITNRRRLDPGTPSTLSTLRLSGIGIALLIAGFALAGCSVPHLQGETVNVGSSVGSIDTSQVLESLYNLANDPNAVPSPFTFSQGTIQTTNSIAPGVSIPLGNQVTRTVASGGITQVVAPYNGLSLQGSEGWTQSWQINPVEDAQVLRTLHFIYSYVVGNICKEADLAKRKACLITKFENVFPQLRSKVTADQDETAALESEYTDAFADGRLVAMAVAKSDTRAIEPPPPPAPAPAPAPASGPGGVANKDASTPAPTIIPSQNDDRLMARIIANCGGTCFAVRNGQSCAEPPLTSQSEKWVCLGRYNSAYQFPALHEMIMSSAAYQKDILFDLVTLSLQLESEAAANSPKASSSTSKASP